MSPKTVMVSGAGGFVGHHFLEHALATTNWNVIATDSFRHKGKTDRIREVLDSQPLYVKTGILCDQVLPTWKMRTSVITHDLTAPFSSQQTRELQDKGVDYMVCFASESHVDRSISDPVPFIRNNTEVALNTLELARVLKPKALIWVSTDEVYGPVEAHDLKGHKEWAPILPSNPYAASKAAQEAIAVSYWRTYGVPVQIVNCFDMQTRVMTPSGPKYHHELAKGDQVWAMDSAGNMVAERVQGLVKRPSSEGKMIRISGKGVSQVVTPGHRMMIQRYVGSSRRWQPIEECLAKDLLSVKSRIRIPRTGTWEGDSSPVVRPYKHFTSCERRDSKSVPDAMATEQVAALFGWYISEGCCTAATQVRIAGSKPGQQEAIRAALTGIEGCVGNDAQCVYLSNGDLADWLRTTGSRSQDKRIPDFIKSMSSGYLSIFFNAACAGDGTRYANGGVYYTSSEGLAYDMAEVAMKLGFSARVSTRETWVPDKSRKTVSWIMRYSPCAGEVEARNVTEEAYDGDVWCLSVPSGRVFVERDGIVTLSGQCMNMIGERQDTEKFVPMVIAKVMRGEEVTIHGTEGNIGTRHYLHSRNLADAVTFLLQVSSPAAFPAHITNEHWTGYPTADRPDRYNIATPDRIDNLTLAKMIAESVGKPLKYKLEDFHSTRPGHDPHYGLDPQKLFEMGWRMPVPLAESLAKTVRWTLKHPEWMLS